MRTVAPRLAFGLVLLAAASVAFPGLLDRDLTGDELGTLGHTVVQMLDRSLETHRPDQFSAHLPLAWLVRHFFLGLLGDDHVLPWRLHAALGHVAGAAVTWAVVRPHRSPRRALGIALIVALHPIAAYHAHDSTNYALDALTGATTLGGLLALAHGKRSAALLLGAGLLLGSVNDYYFAFALVAAVPATLLAVRAAPSRPRAAVAARRAWLAAAALLGPAAVVGLWRFRDTPFAELIARHANPMLPGTTVGLQLHEAAHWFALSWFDGYEAHGRPTPDLHWIALVVLAVALVGGLRGRDRGTRAVVCLVAVFVATMLAVAVVFGAETGREFPVHPRNYLIVLPALALLVGDAATGRFAAPVWLALLLLLGGASARQSLNVTDGRAWAAEEITDRWRPGDRVLSVVPLRFRLGPPQRAAFDKQWCLPPGRSPSRIWLVTFPGGPRPEDLGVCAETEQPAGSLPALVGYRLRWIEDRDLGPHEGPLTNSYLSPTRLMLLDRTPPGPPREGRRVITHRRLLDGADGSTLVLSYGGPDGEAEDRRPWTPTEFMDAPTTAAWVQLAMDKGAESPLIQTQRRPWVQDPLFDDLSLQLTTFGDPRIVKLRTAAGWLLLGVVPLLLAGRRPKKGLGAPGTLDPGP